MKPKNTSLFFEVFYDLFVKIPFLLLIMIFISGCEEEGLKEENVKNLLDEHFQHVNRCLRVRSKDMILTNTICRKKDGNPASFCTYILSDMADEMNEFLLQLDREGKINQIRKLRYHPIDGQHYEVVWNQYMEVNSRGFLCSPIFGNVETEIAEIEKLENGRYKVTYFLKSKLHPNIPHALLSPINDEKIEVYIKDKGGELSVIGQ